jgi:virulence factor
VAEKYHIPSTYADYRELLHLPLDAVCIHASTTLHEEMVTAFIEHGVHVFVDKPLTYHYDSSLKLIELAKQHQVLLRVGFNRRFAPAIAKLQDIPEKDILLLQKNRTALPEVTRTFIMDDFIHVVDTLRFLLGSPVTDLRVRSRKKDGLLHYVMVEMTSGQTTAIGVMHRNSGMSEERLEVISQGDKWVIRNVSETLHYQGKETHEPASDWTPTLVRRGFEPMMDSFLEEIRAFPNDKKKDTCWMSPDLGTIETHALCERIIDKVESESAPTVHFSALNECSRD